MNFDNHFYTCFSTEWDTKPEFLHSVQKNYKLGIRNFLNTDDTDDTDFFFSVIQLLLMEYDFDNPE